jgi:hypothetical protein
MSSRSNEPAAALAEARGHILGAGKLLGLGSAGPCSEAARRLELAVDCCTRFQRAARDSEPDARADLAAELIGLRRSLGRICALLASAAEFHAGVARLAALRASAYGPDGAELGLPRNAGRGSRCEVSG